MIGSVTSLSTTPPPASSVPRQETKVATLSRQDLIRTIITGTPPVATAAALLVFSWPSSCHAMPPQKSYSTNAKNLDRLMNAGDASGGSLYDNHPSAPAARRRRAMQGCKVGSARDEASRILLLGGQQPNHKLSEKECNTEVMQNSPDFMLEALTKLDCPTCPYGIQP